MGRNNDKNLPPEKKGVENNEQENNNLVIREDLKAALQQWEHITSVYIEPSGLWHTRPVENAVEVTRHEILNG